MNWLIFNLSNGAVSAVLSSLSVGIQYYKHAAKRVPCGFQSPEKGCWNCPVRNQTEIWRCDGAVSL